MIKQVTDSVVAKEVNYIIEMIDNEICDLNQNQQYSIVLTLWEMLGDRVDNFESEGV